MGVPPLVNFAAFCLAAFLLIVVPGPSVLFVIGRSIALGRTGGLLSVAGAALGVVPQIVAVAFGVGALLAQSVLLFTIVKIAGALYLVLLGVQAIRRRHEFAGLEAAPARPSPWTLLLQGFLVGLTNPKAIVFFIAVLPQFVDHAAGGVPMQMLVLGLAFIAIALVSDSVWALAAGGVRRWFAGSPRRQARFGAAGGAMMIGLGGSLVLSGSRA